MFTSTKWGTSPFAMQIYKITKIVCELWLAKRSVCMRVCKHGSVVASRCIGFCVLFTRTWIWKSFQVQNLTSLFYLPIPSLAETCKIFTNKLCQFFFRLSWHFKWENPYFGKHLLAKQELIARLRVQDFATGKNSSFNQGTTKSFAFLLGNVILYTRGVGRILDSYANLRRSLGFAQLSRILPTPLCKHGKRFLLLN